MTRRLLVTAAALVVSACEHGVDMEGTVTAPMEVQRLFSAESPGQLFVVATLPAISGLRDDRAVFCVPGEGDRRIAVEAFDFGCAEAVPVRVSAYAVPRTTAQIDCAGPGGVRMQPNTFAPATFDPAAALASGSADVSVEVIGSAACSDGRVRFSLTLAPGAGVP